jgi:hypothetical protein
MDLNNSNGSFSKTESAPLTGRPARLNSGILASSILRDRALLHAGTARGGIYNNETERSLLFVQ